MPILYRHIRPDKNEVFYIGIGEKESRAYSKKDRNPHWYNIVNLNNDVYEVEILFEDISWEVACQKEIEFIKLYGRADLGLGTLCNLTDGGEGTPGRIHKESTIKLISEANKGVRNHNYGKSLPEKHRKKIGDSQRGSKNHMFGKKVSEETRKKMRISKIGKSRPSSFSEKIKLSLTGRKLSEETKDKIAQKATGRKSLIGKKVINIETDKIYDSIKKASIDYELSEKSLANRLNNKTYNDTKFKYL